MPQSTFQFVRAFDIFPHILILFAISFEGDGESQGDWILSVVRAVLEGFMAEILPASFRMLCSSRSSTSVSPLSSSVSCSFCVLSAGFHACFTEADRNMFAVCGGLERH